MTHEYKDFFRYAPGLLCIVSADGGIRAVSAACEELLDLPSSGGGSLLELTHADEAKYQKEYIPTVMREGKWSGEAELMRKDGTVVPVIQSIVILPDENGRPQALATIAHDVSQQKRLEEALRQAINELSTPIIQVWEGVLALPIIGVVDNSRATQMTQALLEAIQSRRCKIAVLDLTGVRTLDTATIDHLFRMIRAAALLGSRCVISGMSPEMAQTVAALGLEMSGLQAFRSLEEALRFAMQATGGR